MNAQQHIREVIAKVSKKDVALDPGQSLFDAGVIDSFSLIDLAAALEETFGVKIPDSDLNPRQFNSITEIEAYLASLK